MLPRRNLLFPFHPILQIPKLQLAFPEARLPHSTCQSSILQERPYFRKPKFLLRKNDIHSIVRGSQVGRILFKYNQARPSKRGGSSLNINTMGDQEVFSDPEEEQSGDRAERERRIHKAFGSLGRTQGEPLSKRDEERVLGIRQALATGDKALAEKHLSDAKQESSWLYEELMKHPEISAIMRELSIMGF